MRSCKRARSFHGTQRRNHDGKTILHVVHTWPDGGIAVAHKALEGTVFFKHRVHMANQQNALAVAATSVLCDEMPRAPHFGHGHPGNLEAERLELRAHHFRNLLDPFGVESAAVDVHEPFEEFDGARRLGVSGGDYPSFGD